MQKEWMAFAAMTTMRLNSQVRQFDGFVHGRRVFCWAPKMTIGAVGDPDFEDFTNPFEVRTAKTHHFSGAIRQIRQASLTECFSAKLNLSLISRIRDSEMGNSFYARLCFALSTNRKTKMKYDG